jgi:periplasmic protein TonB
MIGFTGALLLHGAMFFSLRAGLLTQADFGITEGHSSTEVNLVADLPTPPTETPSPPEPEEIPKLQESELPDFVEEIAKPAPKEKPKPIEQTPPPPKPQVVTSPLKGKDAATLQSDGGTQTRAKPKYLSNPPPVYPERARRLGQEGVVLLIVRVNADGKPTHIEIKDGSGYSLLDESAVKAVHRWQFHPAMLGSIPVSSTVEVPIRFRLKDSER